jgi:hypothetical protein
MAEDQASLSWPLEECAKEVTRRRMHCHQHEVPHRPSRALGVSWTWQVWLLLLASVLFVSLSWVRFWYQSSFWGLWLQLLLLVSEDM